VYFPEVAKYFWPVLDNRVTLCDLSGIFTIANPKGLDHLDISLFKEFVDSFSRVKYPDDDNHLEKLVDDLIDARTLNYECNNSTFRLAMNKVVMRVLLKFDLPLRRVFAAFAGRGGGITWEEVKTMSVGMDIEGFNSFAAAFSLVPSSLSVQRCTTLAREVLDRFPLLKPAKNSTLLYPQFQLLLCFTAEEFAEANSTSTLPVPNTNGKPGVAFGRGLSRQISNIQERVPTPLNKSLADMLKTIGIDMAASTLAVADSSASTLRPAASAPTREMKKGTSFLEDSGSTVHTPFKKPGDLNPTQSNSNRESMVLRMEKLFDEVDARLEGMANTDFDDELEFESFPGDGEELVERRSKRMSKPVVIGDSIPPPLNCPAQVQHSLEAALAHHNLGSYEKSLKYLETAEIHLVEEERQKLVTRKRQEHRNLASISGNRPAEGDIPVVTGFSTMVCDPEVNENDVVLPAESKFYIMACKGNVYQSCGDDEQSLLQYMNGWEIANTEFHGDWEILFVNSIGLLAYYNLQYELALKCFTKVGRFREIEFGARSADTATSWNNQACCLYCLGRKGAARVLFERARNVFVECLGNRHPRSVVASRNCEKAKKCQNTVSSQSMKMGLPIRGDANRLVMGNDIGIQGLPPINPGDKLGWSKNRDSK